MKSVYLHSYETNRDAVINALRADKRKLSSISLVGRGVPYSKYHRFLGSYVTHLENDTLRRIITELPAGIVDASPNMRCDFLLHNNRINIFVVLPPAIHLADLLLCLKSW